ncbi:MAG: hypothetical protein H7122_12715 [Chitinophagaceae bacterium]|nr:hypothetical protein [Chitinophagaceae bacterium]
MKKLLLILAIGAFVACNDNGSDEGTGTDTTVTTGTDTSVVIPVPDTTVRPVDTVTVKPDTSATK